MSDQSSSLLISNVQIFDGLRDELVGGHVKVVDDKIESITREAPEVDNQAVLIDGEERVLMPGLSDAHVHLVGMANSLLDLMTGNMGLIYARTIAEANRVLMRGFTTVRDMGSPVSGLKAAIDEGVVSGPRIYPSEGIISQTSGHGDFSMQYEAATAFGGPPSRGEVVGFVRIADGPEKVTAAVREQLKRGASQIKLMAGGGVSSLYDTLESMQYTAAELTAAVEAASDFGTYVATHTYQKESVRRAIDAGVRSIEHGHLCDEETVKYIAEQDAWLSTQPFAESDHSFPDAHRTAKNKEVCTGTARLYEWAQKHKAKTAFGSDILFEPHKAPLQTEMFARLEQFMDPTTALKMATSGNAELFRLSGTCDPYASAPIGVIEPGAWADLLVVEGDPTRGLSIFADPDKNISVIVKGGRVYKNTL